MHTKQILYLVSCLVAVLLLGSCTAQEQLQLPVSSPTIPATPVVTPVAGEPVEGRAEQGQAVYLNNCAACHGPHGIPRQQIFPTLRGNPFVTADPEGVIEVVLYGRGRMPPFHSQLTDEEIAQVLSFLRTAWNHEADPVDPETVANVRAE